MMTLLFVAGVFCGVVIGLGYRSDTVRELNETHKRAEWLARLLDQELAKRKRNGEPGGGVVPLCECDRDRGNVKGG